MNRRKKLCTGRLAPSPTGMLHLGNAWSFFLAWLSARAENGSLFLRMEDIDPERSRPEWIDGIIRDLRWLGLDWDEAPSCAPSEGSGAVFMQSRRGAYYNGMLERLQAQKLVYPCFCTRRELRELAGAPHGAADGLGDAGAAYPGTCRSLTPEQREEKRLSGKHASLRLRCPEGEAGRQDFHDLAAGRQSMTITECGGDFVLRRSDGVWAYQLAVVCDDIAMGVTQVVRGEDILFSTPRQLFLYRCFGAEPPEFAHIPLLCDSEGQRLAKRHKSFSLEALREAGCRPEAVIGWLAWRAGLQEAPVPALPALLAEKLREAGRFPWDSLPHGPLIVPGCADMQKILLGIARNG